MAEIVAPEALMWLTSPISPEACMAIPRRTSHPLTALLDMSDLDSLSKTILCIMVRMESIPKSRSM